MRTPINSIKVLLDEPTTSSTALTVASLRALALYVLAQIALRTSEVLLPETASLSPVVSVLLFVVLLGVFTFRREYSTFVASAFPAVGETVSHAATDIVGHVLTERSTDGTMGVLLPALRELPIRLGALGLALWVLVSLLRRLRIRTGTHRA